MAEEHRLQGNKYYKQKDIDNAIAAYSKAIDLEPNSPTAALCYSNRSACYQVKKEWVKMQQDAEALAKLKPTHAVGYVRQAIALRKQGKNVDTVKVLTSALKVEGNAENEELSVALATEKAKFAKMLQDEREKKGNSNSVSSGNEALQKVVLGEYQKAMQKYNMSRRSVQEASMQIEQAEREKKAAELTLREVTNLDPSNTVFRSVGKAYVLSSVKECVKRLEDETKEAEERSKGFVKKRELFGRQMKTAENDIREISKTFRKK